MTRKLVRATNMDMETCDQLLEQMVDIRGAYSVEVIVTKGKTLHVNINEVCVLRVQDINFVRIEKRR
jgi:hypothetical protein